MDLPKLKAKLPKLPKDLSRRDALSLAGAIVVLLAIPLTVILFRRYQEARVGAYEDAQIVEGSVKITNIHAHGFTVSWATVGNSTGVVQWGPGSQIGSIAYDDRAEGSASFSSSTHHVTLPHPPGSDEPLGIFEEPNQPFGFKILSGDGQSYGGTFDNLFDVFDVSPTAAPIRVTTGPELAGSGNESYSAYGAYTYTDTEGDHLVQSIYDINGQDAWYRTCPFGLRGPIWDVCTEWVWEDQRNQRGVGNESYSAYGAYTYTDAEGDHLVQSIYDAAGQTGWFRVCPIGPGGTAGVSDWNLCTGWQNVDISNQRGIGNESYSSYGAYTYTDTEGDHLVQSIYDTNGQDAWYRICPIGPGEWAGVSDWDLCTSPNPDPGGAGGWQNVDISNQRGVGNESYSAYGAYVDDGRGYLRQSIIDTNGQDSWWRECMTESDGVDWSSCDDAGDPYWWKPWDLRNERGTGDEPDPVFGDVQKSSGVAAPGAIVYTTVKDSGGTSSAPLSAIANESGRYVLDLGNARTADREEYFSYDRDAADGYWEDISAQGGVDGVAERIGNPTNNDQPIPTLILNHPPVIAPIEDHNAIEGGAYSYQVDASDEDINDTLTYGLNSPPSGMTINQNGLISWPNPTPLGGSFEITVSVDDSKSGGLVATEYTLTVVESADTEPPETVIDTVTVSADFVTFAYHGEDLISPRENLRYSYQLDGGGWSEWSEEGVETTTLTVGTGEHIFEVKAKDEAGLEDPTPAQRSFTVSIDEEGPTITHTPIASAPENQSIGIEATITDPSGVASVGFCSRKADGLDIWACQGHPPLGDQVSFTIPASVVTRAGVDYYITAADAVGNASTHPDGAPPAFQHINIIDATPPAAVTDLTTSNPTNSTLTLNWTAPGNDGNSGTASQYDIRYSTSTITNGNWDSAAPVTGEPTPQVAGSTETFIVTNLSAETTYYFAIKTADEVPLWSGLSNIALGTTLPEPDLTPHTNSVTPYEGPIGTQVTISGSNFGATRGTSKAIFNNNVDAVTYDSWTDTQIVTFVPAGTVTGDVVVQTSEGTSNGVPFTVTEVDNEPPVITHTPLTSAPENQSIGIEATITDPSGVASVGFCSRKSDGGVWGCQGHSPLGDQVSFTIPATAVTQAGVDYYITAADAVGNASTHPDGAPTSYHHINVSDGTAPATITDLSTSNPTNNTLTLTWTAPGDDGNTGTASEYDIRYSTSTITDANWDSASKAVGEPTPKAAGSSETYTVTALAANTTYYFAIKTADEVPNWSALSNVASGTTEEEEGPTATLNISLLMQGRPSYPGDSRGSAGIADLYVREGTEDKVLIADDLAIAADGTATNIALPNLVVGTAYDFLLKGYIHLTVEKPLTLGVGSNSINFGTLLVGDIAGTSDDYADRDDVVNAFDYTVLVQGWRATWNNPQPCPDNYADCKLADFNLDSKVNAFDHNYIFNNWYNPAE